MITDSIANHRLNEPAGKQVLIVVGMHRSGTSATTGALQCLGVKLGDDLYSGHLSINAKGYFEHSDIANTNEEALLSIGSAWDDILLKEVGWHTREELRPCAARIRRYIRRDFSHSPLWAVKDPRISRLLPWWLEIFADENISPHFIFVVRSPDEVYRSLEKRDGFSREKSFLLWLLHYMEAERSSRNHPRTFTLFDQFLENPADELLRIEQQLKIRFPVSVELATDCLDQFLSKDLRHHKENVSYPATSIVDLAHELEARLRLASKATDMARIDINTDDLWQRLEAIQAGFHPLLVEQLLSVGHRRGQLELYMRRVERSISRFAGKPVRFFERLFGRDV